MNNILQYQQMLSQNTSMYDSELSIDEQKESAKEQPIKTSEIGSGMIGLKLGVEKTIEQLKNKIKSKLTQKAEELKDNIKSKLQEKSDELKGKFEEMKQKVTGEPEQKPIVEEPDETPISQIPEEQGPLIEEVSHETIQPSQPSEPEIQEPEIQEPEIQEPSFEQMPENTFTRRYLSDDEWDDIKNQAEQEAKQYRQQLVPEENLEQDSFDLKAQRLVNANRSAQSDIDNEETPRWRANLQQKMINKNNDEIEQIRQQKMDETGEDLNITRSPTDSEYEQIRNFQINRQEELANEKLQQLRQPEEQIEEQPEVSQTTTPLTEETGAIIPKVETGVEEESQALIPSTSTSSEIVESTGNTLAKTAISDVTEDVGVDATIGEASTTLDADPLTAPIGIIMGLASILFGMYHKNKVNDIPKIINTSTSFGA